MGRYPAYYLMGRIPSPNLYISPNHHAIMRLHPVLTPLSGDYPGVRGRLDTRYAPVRRSTPTKSKLPVSFPLDLHVLSL